MDEDMTLDDFKRWKVEALQNFLRDRGLGVSGNKETLIARAFVAWELKLPKLQTAKEYKESVAQSIESLLVVGEIKVPNYKTLTGWEPEDSSMSKRPPTMIQDIGKTCESVDRPIDYVLIFFSIYKNVYKKYHYKLIRSILI